MEHKCTFKKKRNNSILSNFNWILFFLVLGFSISSKAQCTIAINGLYPAETFITTCTGTNQTITTQAYASEYSNVTIQPNKNYTFSSSVATDFVTITNATGTVVYASGTSPLVWSSGAINGDIRYFLHLNSSCSQQDTYRIKYISCQETSCTIAEFGQWPNETYTPSCTGTAETIASDAYAGEYSNVNVLGGRDYSFSSSVTTDVITITNATATVVFASGTTPLVWNSGSYSGVIRFFSHTNVNCGSEEIFRSRRITCQPITNCNAPSNASISNVFSTNAQLNWNAASPTPAGGYEVYYSTTNSISAATVPISTATGTSTYLSNLLPSTTYYSWIRSNCGSSLISSWVSVPSFTTPASTLTGCTTAQYASPFPGLNFTPACTGNVEQITTLAYASEYSNINIITNKQYTFSSSVATDFVTITTSNGITVLASGLTPLVWNSVGNAGVIRFYLHTSSSCGSQNVDRTKTIVCQDAPPQSCTPPSSFTVSNIIPTSAQLNWSAAIPVPSGGYDIYYSTTNSVLPTTIPVVTVTSGLVSSIGGLTPTTTYYYWIRSNCQNSTVSSWVSGGNFTTASVAGSGCVSAPYGLYPGTPMVPNCVTSTEATVFDAYAGQYSNVTILANKQYTFESAITSDYITISNANATQIYASGITPLIWNSGAISGTVRYYIHTNAGCTAQDTWRIKTVSCTDSAQQTCNVPSNLTVSNLFTTNAQLNWNTASPAPNTGYDIYLSLTNSITAATTPIGTVTGLNGQIGGLTPGTTYYFWVRSNCGASGVSSWVAGPSFTTTLPTGTGCITGSNGLNPTTTFTPVCSGVAETIVVDAYAGEYSNVNIVTNKQYTFTSSVATDFITISNANATVIYASGVSPLVWNSGSNTGVIRYYFHTNSGCGEAATNRTRTISCQDAPPTCASPSNLTVSNLFTTSAQLNWNAATPAPANGYQIYYSTVNSVLPTTTPSNSTTGLSVSVTSLAPSTTYYYWVRSNCGNSNVSAWVSGGSFITPTPTGTGCITATYGLFPTATFTPACSGVSETIVTNAYAGEYSNVNIVANKEYTFTSSVVTDYITISNENATVIYASGPSPLVWNSGSNTDVGRYYLHTNASCGESNSNRSKFITCDTSLGNNVFEEQFASLYPNPASKIVNIVGQDNFDHIIIINSLGQIVKAFSHLSNEIQINIIDFPSGVYLIKVESGTKSKTFRLIKE